jgi:hypothetical protein
MSRIINLDKTKVSSSMDLTLDDAVYGQVSYNALRKVMASMYGTKSRQSCRNRIASKKVVVQVCPVRLVSCPQKSIPESACQDSIDKAERNL